MARKKPTLYQQVKDLDTRRALEEIVAAVQTAQDGTVPTGTLIIWDQSSQCPNGYIRDTTYDGVYIKGAASGVNPKPSVTPASVDSSVTFPTTVANDSGSGATVASGSGATVASHPHTHTATTTMSIPTATTDAINVIHRECIFCRKI